MTLVTLLSELSLENNSYRDFVETSVTCVTSVTRSSKLHANGRKGALSGAFQARKLRHLASLTSPLPTPSKRGCPWCRAMIRALVVARKWRFPNGLWVAFLSDPRPRTVESLNTPPIDRAVLLSSREVQVLGGFHGQYSLVGRRLHCSSFALSSKLRPHLKVSAPWSAAACRCLSLPGACSRHTDPDH